MQLLEIAVRQKPRAPMQLLSSAMLTKVAGVAGDFRGKPGNRQVTVLSQQQWQLACKSITHSIAWTARRANLLVDGIAFDSSMQGKALRIGNAVLLITGETEPCRRMDEASPGLRQALQPDWRAGVTCKVIADGRITSGDKLVWL